MTDSESFDVVLGAAPSGLKALRRLVRRWDPLSGGMRCVASVHETGTDRPVCEEPKTPFPYDECGWDYVHDTSGKLLNNTLVEKTRTEDMSVIRELGVWEVVDRPRDEVVFGTGWVDNNKGVENKPFKRSRLVAQECKRQAGWSFFTATPPLVALKFVDLCNSRRAPQ